ncbi:MAG: ABC transporter permease [Acidimicrobiales bacterium]
MTAATSAEAPSETTEVLPRRGGGFIRSNVGLILAPVGIALIGLWLANYIRSTDQDDSTIQRSLEWDSVLFPQLKEHVYITFWSTVFVILIAVPLGILLTRPNYKRLSGPVLAVATSGQATPAFGLLVLSLAWIGRDAWTTIWALTLFTILPVLRNTMVGIDQVDPAVIEAGRGMGLTRSQILKRIELPLAVPVILAGVRTALVINVGMAALAYLVGGGGLGITIGRGIALNRDPVLLAATLMTALVALSVDWIAAVVERVLRPRGL